MRRKREIWIVAGCVGVVIAAYSAWVCHIGAGTCLTTTIKYHTMTFLAGLLACLGVGAFGAFLWLQQLRSYGAALIAIAAFLPGAAAITTVLIFLAPWTVPIEPIYAPFLGSGVAIFAWMILAMFCLRFTSAEHAIPSSYGVLGQRLAQLKSQLDVLCPVTGFPSDPCLITAWEQAKAQELHIDADLKQRGLIWALARGYINAWNRLHRAEEAMIEVAPQETVIAGALNDLLRLQGSKIDHSDDLIARLRHAVDVIDPTANKYLLGAPATALPLVITTPSLLQEGYQSTPYSQTLAASGGTPPIHWSLSRHPLPKGLVLSPDGIISGTPNSTTNVATIFIARVTDSANVTATKAFTVTINAQPHPAPPHGLSVSAAPASALASGTGAHSGYSNPKTQARAVLRDVRGAINEFRDGRWNGLIVARNRLIATMVFTG